jgi:hypothetical protein
LGIVRAYDAAMIAVGLVYTGFLVALIGLISLAKPLQVLRIRSRWEGAAVLMAGVVLVTAGALLPARETTIGTPQTLLDQFAPVFQFHEVHTIRIAASKERVYAAIKAVTADEILFFRALTWIRRLGRATPEGILNPPGQQPILDVAALTVELPGFVGRQTQAGHDEALVLLAEARALVESTGEVRFSAELHRLEGDLRQRRNEPAAAEHCFQRAIALARSQGARWWELRASVSLAVRYGAHNFFFARTGIAMFAHIGVKAEHGEIFVRVNAVLVQEVQRENSGVRGVAARQGESLPTEVREGAKGHVRLCDEDCGKADIRVPHRQHLTLPAELFFGLEIGKRGVPRDIDMPGHQRLD